MGGGSWSCDSFVNYSASVGRTYSKSTRTLLNDYKSSSQAFVSRSLHSDLNPKKVIRECCDTTEHPNTIPIILALDVTGSMGNTAIKIQKQLNQIMEDIYAKVKDAEIMIMAVGDLSYDSAPIQISQFESDIRIAENLDKIYFENGGGGNNWESYTAAWYMGARHTKLDCLNRGKKGVIITMGDENINPYLPQRNLEYCTGDTIQGKVETPELYKEVSEKFDVYHLSVQSNSYPDQSRQAESFAKVIGSEHTIITSVDDVHSKIVQIVTDFASRQSDSVVDIVTETTVPSSVQRDENGDITW